MEKTTIYSPGPSNVRENVRLAMAAETTNPDLDPDFFNLYKNMCTNIGKILKTENDVFVLSGEGILGLEAACASLTEYGDRVLIIENGVFGEGFIDFVAMYGGVHVTFSSDRDKEIDIVALKKFLDTDSNFKYATVVHCDTPSGVLNPVDKICPLLKEYGILTVVDAVSSIGGEALDVDNSKIDIVVSGSQKVFSAPPGLTIVAISDDAYRSIENRESKIKSFYCNLSVWKDYYIDQWFPYTMPVNAINGLNVAVENILDEGIEEMLDRHKKIANSVRTAFINSGIKLHLSSGHSNTVSVIELPADINVDKFLAHIKKRYNLILSGSFGYLSNKVVRIGHMGENARFDKLVYLLEIINSALVDLGFTPKSNLVREFIESYFKDEEMATY
ncbi:MAG: alanine--glyoxylate aminotransferase family protein [Clostridioides sp.]|jgi:aspartate aminotransferase-like enzyme|nr:alanine--glyoxylate aminotransferase family protein [Clostridioides sp.]